jgi:pyruvate-ferredoxin/flavodoxin oxidoreductase
MVTAELVQASEDRRDYWRLLKSIAGLEDKVDVDEIVRQTRTEMAQQLAARFLAMASGAEMNAPSSLTPDHSIATAAAAMSATAEPEPVTEPERAATTPVTRSQPVWIDTPECSSCDECITINPKIFAYNDQKKAIVINPQGGPYKDIVRAAEKCTAGCIHPGSPFDPNEKNLEQLIKRAEKYQ